MPVFEPIDEAAAKDLQCVVCLNCFLDPVELQPCKHIFCRKCLGTGPAPKRCHMCRGDVTSVTQPNRIIINMAQEIKVRCQSCGWVGTNLEKQEHTVCSGGGAAASGGGVASSNNRETTANRSPTQLVPPANANAPFVNMIPIPQQQRQQMPQQYGGGGGGAGVDPYLAGVPLDQQDSYYYQQQQQQSPLATPPPPPPQQQYQQQQQNAAAVYNQPSSCPTGPPGPWDAYGLDQQEYDHIFAIFMTFDTDDSGKLDRSELTTLARYLNFAHTPRDIDTMFREMDSDRTGQLSMNAFCEWISRHRPDPQALYGLTPTEYHEALFQFHQYDRDNSGLIDKNEFRQLAIRMNYARNPAESDTLFRAIDQDNSGEIDLHELLLYLASRKQQQHQHQYQYQQQQQPYQGQPHFSGVPFQAPPMNNNQQQQPYHQQQQQQQQHHHHHHHIQQPQPHQQQHHHDNRYSHNPQQQQQQPRGNNNSGGGGCSQQ